MKVIVIRSRKDYDEKLNNQILYKSFNVYCRVSTLSQIENTSLQTQSELGISYCKKYHRGEFDYIIDWREEGKSGDDRNDGIGEVVRRELLSIIINKWEEGIIRNFWVTDLSRLSRNSDSSMIIKQKLFNSGVDLYVENSKYNFDNKTDKLMFQILSSFNEFENTMRFEKGLMGKRRNLDEGKWWGGNIPFGLKNDGNGYVVEDEVNGKWVRSIFDWYSKGLSTNKIKDRLMKIGVKTNRGNKNWNTSSIRIILSNTFYIGYKEYTVKGIKGKSKEYCDSKGMLYRHTFKCKPIINKKEFDYVQKLLSDFKRVPNTNNKHQFLLKGLIYCKGCGEMMRGKYNDKQNINVYRCISNEENYRNPNWKKCNVKKSVNRVGLEELVWIETLNVFKNSELVKEEFRKNNLPKDLDSVSIKKKIKSNQNKIKVRIKRIENINQKLEENTIKNITLKISDKMFNNIKVGVEKELEKINNEISEFEIQNELWLNNNVWEEWFDSFKSHFNKICKYQKNEDKSKFLNDYIEKINVEWDEKNNTHNIQIQFVLNIVKDKGELIDKDIYKIKKGKNKVKISGINLRKIRNRISKMKDSKTYFLDHSTVTECFKKYGSNSITSYNSNYNSILLKFNLNLKSSKLTKTSHYTTYQQNLYNEIKMLKEEYELGYRRISYLIYEKGYRGIRSNSVLDNRYIYSIYKKGKIRENRINRNFLPQINTIKIFEDL